jgi:hypothetical protein
MIKPRTAVLVTHPDWPWCYQPEDLRPETLKACLQTLKNIRHFVRKAKRAGSEIYLYKTPQWCKNRPLPKKIETLVNAIEKASAKIIVDANHLETNAATIAKNSPAQSWIITGFWKDLCCDACKDGILSVPGKKVAIPRNLSTEIEP